MALDALAKEIVDCHTRNLVLYHWGELLFWASLVVTLIFVRVIIDHVLHVLALAVQHVFILVDSCAVVFSIKHSRLFLLI